MKLASINISVSIILLLSACRKTSSWMMQQRSAHQFQTKTTKTTRNFQFAPIAIISYPNNIFNKEESEPDCPDEDECEIDWGAMPGFEDDDGGERSDQEKEPSNELILI